MSSLLLNNQSSNPGTPASGKVRLWTDSTTKQFKFTDDAGFHRGNLSNYSTASQAPSATVRTYITGTSIAVPVTKLQIGSCFRWSWSMTKTAAGTASSTIDVAVGTAGTTADTARVSFTKPAGTATVDEAMCSIIMVCRGPLTTAGILVGQFALFHNLSATGHATVPTVVLNTVSAGFDVTVANLILGVCLTSGASDAITIQIAQAEGWNL